jgi:hypothetical protein
VLFYEPINLSEERGVAESQIVGQHARKGLRARSQSALSTFPRPREAAGADPAPGVADHRTGRPQRASCCFSYFQGSKAEEGGGATLDRLLAEEP